LDGVEPIFCRRSVARRVVDQLEFAVADIVVDCFRNADRLKIETPQLRKLRDFVGGVHRIVAAVVQKVSDIVSLENLDDPLEVFVLMRLEFVSASSDGTGNRRVTEQGDFLFRLSGEVEKFL